MKHIDIKKENGEITVLIISDAAYKDFSDFKTLIDAWYSTEMIESKKVHSLQMYEETIKFKAAFNDLTDIKINEVSLDSEISSLEWILKQDDLVPEQREGLTIMVSVFKYIRENAAGGRALSPD
jgi:hypothetical protein